MNVFWGQPSIWRLSGLSAFIGNESRYGLMKFASFFLSEPDLGASVCGDVFKCYENLTLLHALLDPVAGKGVLGVMLLT